jgi:hypothetical protein
LNATVPLLIQPGLLSHAPTAFLDMLDGFYSFFGRAAVSTINSTKNEDEPAILWNLALLLCM